MRYGIRGQLRYGITRKPAPTHGQHTDEILGEIGYSREEILQLRNDGVV